MATAARPRTVRWLIGLGLLLILLGFAPLLSALAASLIAETYGCTVNEAGAHPCMIGGTDWGGALVTMFVMGWLILLTIWLVPAGLVVALIGIIRWFRPAQPAPQSEPPT